MSRHRAHTKGAWVIMLAEFLERYSYNCLFFLLVLYLSAAKKDGGLGWGFAEALSLMSTYMLVSYTFPIVGGFIADKLTGPYKAALLGAVLTLGGYISILGAPPNLVNPLYVGLAFMALGTSLFKPSMPTLLGLQYPLKHPFREQGFRYYYVGIKLGALLAALGDSIFIFSHHYREALLPGAMTMLGSFLFLIYGKKHLVISKPDLTFFRFQQARLKLTQEEKGALRFLGIFFIFFGVWALIYNITLTGTLSLFIENYTNRSIGHVKIPTTVFHMMESFFVILFAPLMPYVFKKIYRKRKQPVNFVDEMGAGLFVATLGVVYLAYLCSFLPQEGPRLTEKSFQHYQMFLFVLCISFSEMLISPVILSIVGLFTPLRLLAIFQSFYLVLLGLAGKASSVVGKIALQDPYPTFFALSGGYISICILYFFLKGPLNKAAQKYQKKT